MELVRQKNIATYIVVPLVDETGDPVSSAGSLDSQIDQWSDGGAPGGFGACTNEATEIGATGSYYLSLTAGEMNDDYIIISIASAGAKTQWILIRTMTGDPLLIATTAAGALVWSSATRALTDKAGFTISGTITTLDALDTALDSAHGAGSWATAVGFSTHSAASVWAVGTRALTTPNDYKADVSNLDTTVSSRSSHSAADVWTAGSRALTTPNDYKADVSALATTAALSTHDTDIKSDIAGLNDPTDLEIADAVWDEILTGLTHNINTSAGKRLRQLGDAISGTVDDAGATTLEFITDLTEARDAFYNDQLIRFTTGNLEGHVRIIKDYTGATKTVTVEEVMVEAPDNGIEFDILPMHIHPMAEVADTVWDEIMSGHVVAGSAGEQVRRMLALMGKHQVIDDWTWDGNNNQLTCIVYLYDTKANANSHIKGGGAPQAGQIGVYSQTITFDGSQRPDLKKVVEDS